VQRLNRFAVLAEVEGRLTNVFLPNPGRLTELLSPGRELILRRRPEGKGKTRFEALAARDGEILVPLDSRLPNRLFLKALTERTFDTFSAFPHIKPEYPYLDSRFDFMLSSPDRQCIVEVKSCTLVRHGVALFPDAPTARGTRHLRELKDARRRGFRACVAFIIQRNDASVFAPYWARDPEFASTLLDASKEGVEVFAWKVLPVDESLRITLDGRVRVRLSAPRTLASERGGNRRV